MDLENLSGPFQDGLDGSLGPSLNRRFLGLQALAGVPVPGFRNASMHNCADEDRFKQSAEQQGVNQFEVQESDARLLFSHDTSVKDLGIMIIRDLYNLSPSIKVMEVNWQGRGPFQPEFPGSGVSLSKGLYCAACKRYSA